MRQSSGIRQSPHFSEIQLDSPLEKCDGWMYRQFAHPAYFGVGARLVIPAWQAASRNSSGHAAGGTSTRSDAFMLHVTCDLCGKAIRPGQDLHFVVKVEVFAASEPAALTEADLDEDHLEAVSKLLREMDENGDPPAPPPVTQERRYDLCCACRERFLRDPLGKESTQKFHFSEN
jgi:hypothetical protein